MDAVCILRRSEILSATIDGIVIWCTCPIVIGPEVHDFDIHWHKDTEFRSQLALTSIGTKIQNSDLNWVNHFLLTTKKNAKNNGW